MPPLGKIVTFHFPSIYPLIRLSELVSVLLHWNPVVVEMEERGWLMCGGGQRQEVEASLTREMELAEMYSPSHSRKQSHDQGFPERLLPHKINIIKDVKCC